MPDERDEAAETDRRASPPMEVSVIIPTLDEAAAIVGTLRSLRDEDAVGEVIVVDGGSKDATVDLARELGAAVIRAERCRGSQLRAGVAAARGDALWFLHADTVPPPGSARRIVDALLDPSVAGGGFEVRFSGDGRAARWFTRVYPIMRRLGCLYGDAALFARRGACDAIGGFRPYPVFEDVDFVRRLRRVGRVVCLPGPVVTSSRRFEGRPIAGIVSRWALLHLLYWLGVPPERLARLYPPAGSGKHQALRRPPPRS